MPLGYQLTAGFNLEKPFCYSPEATYGNIDLTSPVYTPIAITSNIKLRIDNKTVDIAQVGMEELYNIISTGHDFGFSVSVFPFDLPLLKYGSESPNYATPAGTAAESLTFLIQMIVAKDADGLWGTHFIKIPGSVMTSLEMTLDSDGAVMANTSWLCQQIEPLSLTSGLTTPDLPDFADITGNAISHLDVGDDLPLEIDVNGYPIKQARLQWNNTVETTRFVNSDLINSALMTSRLMTGSFSTGFGLDHDLQAILRDRIQYDGKLKFKTGAMVATLEGIMLTNSEPELSTGVMVPDYNFKCNNMTLGTS